MFALWEETWLESWWWQTLINPKLVLVATRVGARVRRMMLAFSYPSFIAAVQSFGSYALVTIRS